MPASPQATPSLESAAGPEGFAGFGAEADEASAEPDLSDGGIRERLGGSRETFGRIVDEFLNGDRELHAMLDETFGPQGAEALRAVREGDARRIERSEPLRMTLEAIIKTDGSRPSFLVQGDEVNRRTSPLGQWGSKLDDSGTALSNSLKCVGRIDDPASAQGFRGTGFLVHPDHILTNRHVLQGAARFVGDEWRFNDGVAIDFGREFRGQASVNPRALKRVVFCGSRTVGPDLDHAKLDLALIELGSGDPALAPSDVLAVDVSPDWPQSGTTTVYVAGFPGSPPPWDTTYQATLLERLFKLTYGHKRLAPGLVMEPTAGVSNWTVTHDATTLGGNSGSCVLVADRGGVAAGLHYAGIAEFANWGHVLGGVLDSTDGRSDVTLRDHLARLNVKLVDPFDF